jgi:hypothetical protein
VERDKSYSIKISLFYRGVDQFASAYLLRQYGVICSEFRVLCLKLQALNSELYSVGR